MEGSLVAYKVFSNGSVLNASEINDNLMNQSVMVFSNSAARTAALTTPVAGMVTYLEDSEDYDAYDGTAWIPIASLGAWKTYAPNLDNSSWTLGNGTFDARYIQIGKTVHFNVVFTTGSTTVEGANLRISFPVPALEGSNLNSSVIYVDGSTRIIGLCTTNTSTSAALAVMRADVTYAQSAGLSATIPFTWAAGDEVQFSGTYEAA
jgi:hypothetical protein